MRLFDDGEFYSEKHDRIFNLILPMLAREKQTDLFVLSRVAYELNISYDEYIKYFIHHPEWPSPKTILLAFEELKNGNK